MPQFFEFDPVTGIKTDTAWDEQSQQMTLIRTADVEPVLNYTRERANTVGLNREDIKEGWWCYAKLPPIVILQMRAKGIDVTNRDHQDRMFQEINENYPHLKMTTGNEGKIRRQVIG